LVLRCLIATWLSQFDIEDEATAITMIGAMRRVSSDDFVTHIRARVFEAADETDGAVALYAERVVLPYDKKLPPDPLFSQPADRPRRATGARTMAVDPNYEVGSEGIIAQLITELNRGNPKTFLNHPGAEQLICYSLASRINYFFGFLNNASSRESGSRAPEPELRYTLLKQLIKKHLQ